MKLGDLLKGITGLMARTLPACDPEITGVVSEDSRTITPGSIFIARTGLNVDGHRFIGAALSNGAAAVFGEKAPAEFDLTVPYCQVSDSSLALAQAAAALAGYPSRRLVVIGVTGTDGKTTTTTLIHSILVAAGIRAGMISTINAVLGDEEVPTGLHVTTPTAPEVQGYLKQMADAGLTHCVLEATSHGLAQNRVAACDFDVAVMTNIMHEHLDFHGTWEAYRDAKAMLFHHLKTGFHKAGVPKIAVINRDDEASAATLLAIPADQQVAYAIDDPAADCLAEDLVYGPDATAFTLVLPGGARLPIRSDLVGVFNVSNMLAAASAAAGLGIAPTAIKAGIEAVKGISGRMQRIDEGQDFLAVVDFAHTPNALRRALEASRLLIPPAGRVIAVWGSAGLRDVEKRRLMAGVSGQLADITVVTAEDPRTEDLDDIIAASAETLLAMGGVEGETFFRVPDRGEAIHFATRLASPGDIVISCGKGHEQSMCFGTTEYPWDDREAMRAALKGAPLKTLPTARGG